MNQTSKATLAKLEADITSGVCIPDFYFAFFSERNLHHLLEVAEKSQNAAFYEQVQRVVFGRSPKAKPATRSTLPDVITIRIPLKKNQKWPGYTKKKVKRKKRACWRSDKEKYVLKKRNAGFGGKASIVHRKR